MKLIKTVKEGLLNRIMAGYSGIVIGLISLNITLIFMLVPNTVIAGNEATVAMNKNQSYTTTYTSYESGFSINWGDYDAYCPFSNIYLDGTWSGTETYTALDDITQTMCISTTQNKTYKCIDDRCNDTSGNINISSAPSCYSVTPHYLMSISDGEGFMASTSGNLSAPPYDATYYYAEKCDLLAYAGYEKKQFHNDLSLTVNISDANKYVLLVSGSLSIQFADSVPSPNNFALNGLMPKCTEIVIT